MATNNFWSLEWDEETKKTHAGNEGSGSEESAEELFEDSSEYATSVEEEGSSSERENESENEEQLNDSAQNQEVVLEEIVGEQTIDEGGRVLWRNALDQIVAQEIDVEQQQQDDESENSELLIAVAHDAEQRRGDPTCRNEYPNTSSSRNQENCVVEYMEEVVPSNIVEGKIKKKKSNKKKRKKKSKLDSKGGGAGEKGKKVKEKKDVVQQQIAPEVPVIETKSEPKMKKECPICDKVLSSKEAFRTHLKLHNDPEIFNCKLCDKCFKFKQSLDRHMSHHTGHFPFYCGICEKGFVKGKRCRDHELVHLKEYLKGIGRSKTTLFDLTSEELQALKEIVKADFKNQQENGTLPPATPSTAPKRSSRKMSNSDVESEPQPKYIKSEDDNNLIDEKKDGDYDDVIETRNDVDDTLSYVKETEKDVNVENGNHLACDTAAIEELQHQIKVKEEVVEEEEEEIDDVEQIENEVEDTNEVETERKMGDKSDACKEGSKTYAKFYSVGDRTWKKKRKSKTPLRLKIKLGQQKQ